MALVLPTRAEGQDGAGLVSVVLVLAILGVLAVVSLSVTEGPGEEEGPAGDASPQPPAGAAPAPRAAGDQARQAACEADYRAVEAAVATKHAIDGTFPLTVEQLAQEGWLSGPVAGGGAEITLEVVDGAATGSVLVDGRPGPEGCGAP